MRNFLASLGLFLLPALFTACEPPIESACTLVGCAVGNTIQAEDGVVISVKNAVGAFTGSMPVSLHVCVDAACSDLLLEDDGGTITCKNTDAAAKKGSWACNVDASGNATIELANDMENDNASIQLTAKDAAGKTLFDETKSVDVDVNQPNGPSCDPTCRSAAVEFAPVNASP